MAEKTVAEQIAEAVAASEVGLKNKNKTLMKETKDAKALLKKFDGVDLEALQKASTDLTELRANKRKEEGDYKKLYEDQQAQHKTSSEASITELADTKKTLATERRSNALTLALVENHVKPELVSSAVTILDGNVAVTDEGVVMAGDKTVTEFVKEWSVGDVGKSFVTDANSGGGANGDGGSGNTDAAFFDPNSASFNRTEQGKIATADPARYKALVLAAPQKKAA